MSEKFIRVYKKYDVSKIKPHLMIYGDLSASCANCNHMGVKLENVHCPECNTEFKYISFRNIRVHMPKLQKLIEQRPVAIVDYDDYQKNVGASKAEDFFK